MMARTCSRSRISGVVSLRIRFGRQLQSLRLAAGKGLGDAAYSLAMSQARLEDIESGIEEIDLSLMAKFATSLNVPVAALFAGL